MFSLWLWPEIYHKGYRRGILRRRNRSNLGNKSISESDNEFQKIDEVEEFFSTKLLSAEINLVPRTSDRFAG